MIREFKARKSNYPELAVWLSGSLLIWHVQCHVLNLKKKKRINGLQNTPCLDLSAT